MKPRTQRRRTAARLIGVAVAPLAVAAALLAAPLAAQSLGMTSGGELEFPDITVLGHFDPNVRKATAIVNGDIVTDTDVDHRLGLVMMASGGQVSEEEQQMLRLQVLRNLIDEKLEIQEAEENDVSIASAEIDQALQRVAANFDQSIEQFSDYLRQGGSSPESIRHQIHAELAWGRLLRKRIEPFVNVGDDEVESIIRKLEQSKGEEEFRVGEILLSANAENQSQVLQDANRIVEQIRNGASFVAYARQFSEASTAAVGGDLGWVRAEQLSPNVQHLVASMQRGSVSDPVIVPGGVTILALIDSRKVLAADPANAILSLKQLTIPVDPQMSEDDAYKLAARIQERTHNMGGCGRADEVARELGASVVSNDQMRLGDLPPQLQEILGQMPVGTSTPPFGSAEEGLRVLVLCGRDDAPVNASMPSFDQVYSQLNDQRVNSAARRYLRDLRRDAVIDYR